STLPALRNGSPRRLRRAVLQVRKPARKRACRQDCRRYLPECGIKDMTEEDLKMEIERLKAENEALKTPARGQISLKVSEKGGVSVYGLGRFPVTLYKEQWTKLLAMVDQIKSFIQKYYHMHK